MSRDDKVFAALKALADADRAQEAPPEVEARLRAAFRGKRRRLVWPWAIAAAAAIIVIFAATYLRPKPVGPVHVAADPPKTVQPVAVAESVPPQARKPVRVSSRRPEPREIVTDFFPLMDAPPPLDRAELVRVNLPAAAMRTVGLPVREDRLDDRVQADVLVSEEGLATAIRFVKFQ